jgi:hypothetical protein
MRASDQLPIVQPLRSGWGPVIYLNGAHLSARVLECQPPIEPGESGQAIIAVMVSEPAHHGWAKGAVFELRDGPKTVIATATVLEFSIS